MRSFLHVVKDGKDTGLPQLCAVKSERVGWCEAVSSQWVTCVYDDGRKRWIPATLHPSKNTKSAVS